jgi:hypothetical protein
LNVSISQTKRPADRPTRIRVTIAKRSRHNSKEQHELEYTRATSQKRKVCGDARTARHLASQRVCMAPNLTRPAIDFARRTRYERTSSDDSVLLNSLGLSLRPLLHHPPLGRLRGVALSSAASHPLGLRLRCFDSLV